MTELVVALAVLLLVAAAATARAVRTARAVASEERLRGLAAEGSGSAAAALRTLLEPDRSVGLLQVLVPLAGVSTGWVVVAGLRDASGGGIAVPVVVALVVVAPLVVLLADALPSAAGLAAPERVLVALGWPHRALAAALWPLVTVSGWVASAVLLPVGMWLDSGRRRGHTADELAELVGEHDDTDRSRRLLAGALGFLEVTVGDVMAPREELVTVPHTSTVAEAEQLVHRSGHSRVLVVGATGEVTGFLHAKDLIALPAERSAGLLPAGLVRVALRVEPTDRVQDLLLRMRRARRHVAVVEQGRELLGLVTLEDVLEAIVGDIRDESDLEDGEQDRGQDAPRHVDGRHVDPPAGGAR